MAGTYPNLGVGTISMYPVTKDFIIPAKVVRFLDDTEQRWVSGPIRNSWVIQNGHINWSDVMTLQTFFNTQKGAFDTSWTFPFEGTNYTNCTFEDDGFTYTEIGYNKYQVNLKFRQTQQSGTYTSASSLVYPIIAPTGQTAPFTVVTQYPFDSIPSYLTTRNEMTDSGLRYKYSWRSTPLYAWNLRYNGITDTEVGTFMNFYIACLGQLKTFSFTDPNGWKITNISNANPTHITTATNTNLVSGQKVTIDNTVVMTGNTFPQIGLTVTVIDQTHFTVPIDTTLWGSYVSGGNAYRYAPKCRFLSKSISRQYTQKNQSQMMLSIAQVN